ncbi:MAG TPA: OmpH family outer membrane protein [Dokdonella sp.]|uniref:OmpH family outer membrane protein n=1 Tax=Dokdonella sp. TaxID=2291710 RepID=UPI002C51FB46|nr:OmpH family outer membrane protein [Xanthomonadales bacterium]HQV72703.1 OmpH family outer membrane protein [Dokdonella sp.]HQW76538.1 OmpH family outer membrane protein [Dokdonella sp.]
MKQANRAIRIMLWRTLPIALLLAFSSSLMAQPAAMRIGYVDMKRLLDNAPQVIAGRQKLEREFAPRDSELSAEETKLATMRSRHERDSASMDRADAENLRREIDALDRSIKRKRENLRSELKSRSDQELDRSWREINNAVVEFAREQNIDLIVPSPVVYASQRIDVTDQVLERLKGKLGKPVAKP